MLVVINLSYINNLFYYGDDLFSEHPIYVENDHYRALTYVMAAILKKVFFSTDHNR